MTKLKILFTKNFPSHCLHSYLEQGRYFRKTERFILLLSVDLQYGHKMIFITFCLSVYDPLIRI